MVRLALVLFAVAAALPAQVKLAIINSQQAVVDTAEIKKAQGEMEAKFKPRQGEVEKLQQEMAALGHADGHPPGPAIFVDRPHVRPLRDHGAARQGRLG